MIGDNADEIADAIQEFLTGARAPVEVDRVLSVRRKKPPRSATALGATFLISITPLSEPTLLVSVVVRSNQLVMAFYLLLTARRALRLRYTRRVQATRY